MKICSRDNCTLNGKPQKESDYHWVIKGKRRSRVCATCTNTDNRKKRKKIPYENTREKDRLAGQSEAALFNQIITRRM